MSVKEFKSYVSQNNFIEKAEISLFPFWSPSLPKTKRLLHIVVR
jgi:guanylate kinase